MNTLNIDKIRKILDEKEKLYNNPIFIENDPICIPHKYTKVQDIEIMGFFASIFAWGQRPTIIKKCLDLSARMDNSPYDFVQNHQAEDLKVLLGFKHRTFNDTDLLYCIDFFKRHYSQFNTLEAAFVPEGAEGVNVEKALIHFYSYFFESPDAPSRTRKHVSSPLKKSACKRLNMFLRWMVRLDTEGVDFGIWKSLQPKDLICPLDVHVERTARFLGLLTRAKSDWLAAVELTENLKIFDSNDPVKYDFALFGISNEKMLNNIEVY